MPDGMFPILFFFIVVGIPVLSHMARKMWIAHLEHKERMAGFGHSQGAERHELISRLEKLEQRIRVLERLATDRGAQLSDEIENLRGAS